MGSDVDDLLWGQHTLLFQMRESRCDHLLETRIIQHKALILLNVAIILARKTAKRSY